MTERVLVFAAHPDDESLGCGGTIARHCQQGDPVSVVCMADGVGSRSNGMVGFSAAAKERHGMFRRACKILGTVDVWIHQFADNLMDNVPLLQVVQHVERHIERFKPTVVYTHHAGDLNIDHRITNEAVRVACRPQPGHPTRALLFFEVQCSTTWAGNFAPRYFVDIGATLETKLAAFGCYPSEMREPPHPRSMAGVSTQASWRGSSVGIEYAEAFEIGRIVT